MHIVLVRTCVGGGGREVERAGERGRGVLLGMIMGEGYRGCWRGGNGYQSCERIAKGCVFIYPAM